MKTLILGGVRSGKSRLAEEMAAESDLEVVYIATAQARDDEMRQRIEAHQQRRPAAWQCREEPVFLARALQDLASDDTCLLVDCLSLWVTNLLLDPDPDRIGTEVSILLELLPECPGEFIFVSSESNMGVVPMGELSRRYCDALGLLHQDIAHLSDQVILTVAGLPHYLKGASA